MAYVITQNCCKDASCVPVCPVDCIRPDPAGEFADAPMLYIDPVACIDCGACMEECPVGAIYYEEDLPADQLRYRDLNAAYFERHPLQMSYPAPAVDHRPVEAGSLRVAIVGTGPAALYAASELLRIGGVEVNLFDRLPTPYGLIRAGVAPDHQRTKAVADSFRTVFADSRAGCYLNVEIGRDLIHEELAARHHAVIYAVGASRSRDLGIPGEQLTGSHAASDFVAWYNGHPDHAADDYDLSGDRAVIIGNGNVALDVARILVLPRGKLLSTDIADHALAALSRSNIREVVVLGRRGARHAAFSAAELIALSDLPGVDIVVEARDLAIDDADDVDTVAKLRILAELAERTADPGNKRIVLRFDSAPTEIVGRSRAEGVRIAAPGTPAGSTGGDVIESALILRSIGYVGDAIAGLPFDRAAGVVPNDHGRVVEQDRIVAGVYVTGWIKRGARGVIGTNRQCARETVSKLWDDFDAGLFRRDVRADPTIAELLSQRGTQPVDTAGWRAIDTAECDRGAELHRPRVKFVDLAEMLAASHR
ncbi:FAD-dependent oxidoreductase [Mycobacterium sp.]|uniref:FAD-dependent oxidoreductase n=1 Tax=Mycobacterium sp. TaxID=1785 RepID=UPI000CC9ADDE|nr:FAD-dependent oxidoreductase [Mycobacterium sp.]PJE05999.1 MAG: ferredoxin [Mycobacterium sp.]